MKSFEHIMLATLMSSTALAAQADDGNRGGDPVGRFFERLYGAGDDTVEIEFRFRHQRSGDGDDRSRSNSNDDDD